MIGMDGGSTSSKAVLIDYDTAEILTKEYQLEGKSIQDTKEILARIQKYVADQNAELQVMGFGATGYAADVLQESVKSDCNIVETVAHMMSAVHFFGDVDVICDIGGRTSKVLFMENGDIKISVFPTSVRRATECSCKAMAGSVRRADYAVCRRRIPRPIWHRSLSYGCAVF